MYIGTGSACFWFHGPLQVCCDRLNLRSQFIQCIVHSSTLWTFVDLTRPFKWFKMLFFVQFEEYGRFLGHIYLLMFECVRNCIIVTIMFTCMQACMHACILIHIYTSFRCVYILKFFGTHCHSFPSDIFQQKYNQKTHVHNKQNNFFQHQHHLVGQQNTTAIHQPKVVFKGIQLWLRLRWSFITSKSCESCIA